MNDEITLASLPKRALAFFIDELILSTLFLIAISDKFSFETMDNSAIQGVILEFFVYYIFMQISYQTIFVWLYGATFGKKICKIRCVNLKGEKPNFLESFLRAIFRIVGEKIFYLGFVLAFFTELRQALHDYIARTLVVND